MGRGAGVGILNIRILTNLGLTVKDGNVKSFLFDRAVHRVFFPGSAFEAAAVLGR